MQTIKVIPIYLICLIFCLSLSYYLYYLHSQSKFFNTLITQEIFFLDTEKNIHLNPETLTDSIEIYNIIKSEFQKTDESELLLDWFYKDNKGIHEANQSFLIFFLNSLFEYTRLSSFSVDNEFIKINFSFVYKNKIISVIFVFEKQNGLFNTISISNMSEVIEILEKAITQYGYNSVILYENENN